MTSVERKLDKIIALLTAMAQHSGTLPRPKAPKPKPRDTQAEVAASKRNFENMMARRRSALDEDGSDFPSSTVDIEEWRKGRS
jgi:hypothetical protein